MKEYKYICANDIDQYDNWNVIATFPSTIKKPDMVLIMKEEKPIQNYIKLNEATDGELIDELIKRLSKNYIDFDKKISSEFINDGQMSIDDFIVEKNI